MPKTFIIAEAGSTWEGDLQKAYRLIRAAKDCDASAVKFQWTSNPEKMAARRGNPDAAPMYRKYLAWPQGMIPELKAKCDEVGIQLGITTFLTEDIGCVVPYVDFLKISAFEGMDYEFVGAHRQYRKRTIISNAKDADIRRRPDGGEYTEYLYCVQEYPAPLGHMNLRNLAFREGYLPYDGLSDHTTSLLTGAVAVAMDAMIVEKHIRLYDTAKDNPDYPHSLCAEPHGTLGFAEYVANIREAEAML